MVFINYSEITTSTNKLLKIYNFGKWQHIFEDLHQHKGKQYFQKKGKMFQPIKKYVSVEGRSFAKTSGLLFCIDVIAGVFEKKSKILKLSKCDF